MRTIKIKLASLLSLLNIGIVSAQPETVPTTPLTIQVVDGLTRQAISEVELRLSDTQHTGKDGIYKVVFGPVKPNAQGALTIPVNPGSYVLTAVGRDIDFLYYGALDENTVRNFEIKPGQSSHSITFPIFPPGRLTGTVRDELGERLNGVQVNLISPHWQDARIQFRSTQSTQTDDLGRYSFGKIRAGGYVVCAYPRQDSQLPLLGPVDFVSPPRPRYYQQTCSSGQEPQADSLLRVNAGSETVRDISLSSEFGNTVSGHVVGVSDQAPVSISMISEGHAETSATARARITTPDFEFALRHVAPGRYRVQASVIQSGSESLAATIVDVAGDVTGLSLSPRFLNPIELAYEEAEPGLAANVSQVVLRNRDALENVIPIEENGSRLFKNVHPGIYILRHTTKNGTCVIGATLGDQNVFRQLIRLDANSRMRLTLKLSKHCAGMEGRVTANGAPAPWVKVGFLLSGTPAEPGYVYTLFSGPEGKFSLSDLAPGRYLVWSWIDDNTGFTMGPTDLRKVQDQLTVVEISDGKAGPIEVQLLGSKTQETK